MYVCLSLVIPAHNDSEQSSAVLCWISGEKLKNAILYLEKFFYVISHLK